MADFFGLKFPIVADDKTAKGLNGAKKNISSFEKSAKKAGAAIAAALSVQAIANFGKASVQAFIDDQKQASQLAKVIDNLGLSFANAEVAKFIADLESASAVADDHLRPAFQTLITTTGSLIKSQELLKQAVDISAGSGVELETVANDLAQAYVGNTKGLKKYNTGLTQAEIKTKSFAEVQALLNKQFSGSNAAYLQTYAGQMEVLTVAAGNAQETIGQALVNSLMDFTGAVDAADLASKIEGWSKSLATFIDNFTWGFKKLWFLTSDKALLSMLNPWSTYIDDGLAKIDAERAAGIWADAMAGSTGFDPLNNALTGYKVDEAAKKKAEAAAKARAAALARSTKANTEALKKQTELAKKQALLKKQAALFDLAQIQLVAALKGQLTDEDAKKIKLQLALIQGNEYEARKLTDELANSIDSTGKLAESLRTLPTANNPFVAWKGYLDEIELQAKRVASYGNQNAGAAKVIPPVVGGNGAPIPTTNAEAIATGNNVTGFNRFGVETGGNQTIKIDLHVDGKQIAQVLQDASLSGNQVYVNRITGGFYQ